MCSAHSLFVILYWSVLQYCNGSWAWFIQSGNAFVQYCHYSLIKIYNPHSTRDLKITYFRTAKVKDNCSSFTIDVCFAQHKTCHLLFFFLDTVTKPAYLVSYSLVDQHLRYFCSVNLLESNAR